MGGTDRADLRQIRSGASPTLQRRAGGWEGTDYLWKTGGQTAETRDQRPEIRDQRSETRDQRPETRNQRSETRDQRPETRDERSGQWSEDDIGADGLIVRRGQVIMRKGQWTMDRGRQKGDTGAGTVVKKVVEKSRKVARG